MVTSGPGGLGFGTVVNSGGEEDVDGGLASATTISSGGIQAVAASGHMLRRVSPKAPSSMAATKMTKALRPPRKCRTADWLRWSYDGASTDTQVGAGGTEVVSAGGSTTGTVVSSGGLQVVGKATGWRQSTRRRRALRDAQPGG